MSLIITSSQKVNLAIKPIDKRGNAAQVDGVPQWSVSDEAIASLVVSEDGLSSTLSAVGPLGHVQVSVTADADLGEGVRNLSGALEVDVVAGEAVSLGIISGTPEEIE